MKNLIHRALRKSKRWLFDSPHDPFEGEQKRLTSFAYSDLNCKLLTLMAESGKTFRAHYAWGVLHAAHLARALGLPSISVADFGCAGGNGLVALEDAATRVDQMFGVSIQVYGFDAGAGLPPSTDYRDMPNIYRASDYAMDVDQLKKRLRRTDLRIGLISKTVPDFVAQNPAPIGFISVDVDLYTSTVDTLKVLDADPRSLLPRVHCYFDDIVGTTCADFLGERLAIAEFNETHTSRKLSPIFGLWNFVPRRFSTVLWPHMFYLAHILDHPLYSADDGLIRNRQRPCRT
jgi:hypothetical protein